MKRLMIGLALITASCASYPAVEIGVGAGGECFQVVSELQRNWLEVRRHLVPATGEFGRPKNDDFVCVWPGAVQDAMESRIATADLRCFRQTVARGLGFCCDQRLSSCAQLNPGLFPELYEQPGGNKPYKAPDSIWVQPPAEGDQWKSN